MASAAETLTAEFSILLLGADLANISDPLDFSREGSDAAESFLCVKLLLKCKSA